ncbi:DUF2853 family protein [Corynebacterium uberis]|uniref:DUF2853 family protein n=1 Tax=Corynebacterium TaxID=1716 RepID=UPI001D0A8DBA|nr:DUF2853 family protein [Corynebacterium uberis]MCZ9309579.1 DUF2853 family protein [Corynebacterium sp. c6VSa_13]UDL73390.1 DUF2853 family protein [Corynebacterium uberis]UDL75731.1 DUF2853 family protein [Corynebacterium uberis]UDL77943.1 DUF2853 family protein [Corynebacterium uberis]UDL80227.1 DUF2853 family protein [Corynebacterium uberis]
MAQDPREDLKKYAPNADQAVVDNLYNTYRLVLSKPDASLVSFTDPEELATVRESFLKKKLGLSLSEAELDAGIEAVGKKLAGENRKNRLTVYYLLAEHFNKLSVFK